MSDSYKRGVITEELLSITEDFREAVILRQFLFWLPRMRDVDAYVEEVLNKPKQKSNGWIYKSAGEMAEEVMCASRATVARRIEALVEAGYLDKRSSQRDMDTTNEYRINPSVIEDALNENGYSLATVVQGKHWPVYKKLMEKDDSVAQSEQPPVHSEQPAVHSEQPPVQSEHSAPAHNAPAPSETTTETTSENGRGSSACATAREPPEKLFPLYDLYREDFEQALGEYTAEDADALVMNQWGQASVGSATLRLKEKHNWPLFVAGVIVTANEANNPNPRYLNTLLKALSTLDEQQQATGKSTEEQRQQQQSNLQRLWTSFRTA